MGTITIKQGENKFKVQIRQGNCLAVFIHVSKQEDRRYLYTLYSFYADEAHLKRIIKNDGNPFWGWGGKYQVKYVLQGVYDFAQAPCKVSQN